MMIPLLQPGKFSVDSSLLPADSFELNDKHKQPLNSIIRDIRDRVSRISRESYSKMSTHDAYTWTHGHMRLELLINF